MSLAIAWGIVGSSPDFWQLHKTRLEIIIALFDFRAEHDRRISVKEFELEMAKEKAMKDPKVVHAPLPSYPSVPMVEDPLSVPNGGGDISPHTQADKRRKSLVAIGQTFNNPTYSGDQFGTRGDYTDGIIYASRRKSMDKSAQEKMEEERLAKINGAKRRTSITQALLVQQKSNSGRNSPFDVDKEAELMRLLEQEIGTTNNNPQGNSTEITTTTSTVQPQSTHPENSENKSGKSSVIDQSNEEYDSFPPEPLVPFRTVPGGVGDTVNFSPSSPSGTLTAPLSPSQSSNTPTNNSDSTISTGNRPKVLTIQVPEKEPTNETVPIRIKDAKGVFHRIGSQRFFPGPDRPRQAAEDGKTDSERQREVFYSKLEKFGEGKAKTPTVISLAQLAATSLFQGSSAERAHRNSESATFRQLRSTLGIGVINDEMQAVRTSSSYRALSSLLQHERSQQEDLMTILDKKKTPSKNLIDLMSFVNQHIDEIPGATGGLLNDALDDIINSTPGLDSTNFRNINISATSFSSTTSPSALPAFSPVKSKPSESSVAAKLSKPMLERQLTKVDLYYRPVDSTNKEVIVLGRNASPHRDNTTVETSGPSNSNFETTTQKKSPLKSTLSSIDDIHGSSLDNHPLLNPPLRKLKKPAWGAGKEVNLAESTIDNGRRKPKIPDVNVPVEFSPEELEARRLASERSLRLMQEIRAIERQLLKEESMDRARSKSPRSSPPPALGNTRGSNRAHMSGGSFMSTMSSSPGGGTTNRGSNMHRGSPSVSSSSPVSPTSSRPKLPSGGYFPKSRSGRVATVGSQIVGQQLSPLSGYNSLIDLNNSVMYDSGSIVSSPTSTGQHIGSLPPPTTAGSITSINSSIYFPGNYDANTDLKQSNNSIINPLGPSTSILMGGPSIASSSGFMDALGLSQLSLSSDMNHAHFVNESALDTSPNKSTGRRQTSRSKSPRTARSPTNNGSTLDRPPFFPSEAYEPSTLGVNERDKEFDRVAKKLAKLRSAELKQRGEMRLIKTYTSLPLV